MRAATALDFYKTNHKPQYPAGTNKVYSNFTPRSARLFKGSSMYDDKVVNFGMLRLIKDFLIREWNETFFERPRLQAVGRYKRRMDTALGEGVVDTSHLDELFDLGYLPIEIKALPEGTRSPIKVPVFTITETDPRFFWLVNYLESVLSTESWKAATMATIAYEFRRVLEKYAFLTGAPSEFVKFQGHDFSMRGLSNREEAYKNSIAHLTSFFGTDTVLAIDGAEDFYNADAEKELIGTSVNASEHSTVTMSIADYIRQTPGMELDDLESRHIAEYAILRQLITEVFPSGIVSYVSDSYDYWYTLGTIARELQDVIRNREKDANGFSKVVFRPDSGDPESIICGLRLGNLDDEYENLSAQDRQGFEDNLPNSAMYLADYCFPGGNWDGYTFRGKNYDFKGKELSDEEVKGSLEVLWDIFGGTVNDKGFRELDPCVGLIYGDSITIERAESILARMMDMGFASNNIIFGIGSFSYQYITRDTLGFAMKATYGEVNGEPIEVFKDPKTDSGVKKSAKGLLCVVEENGEYVLKDQCTPEQEASSDNMLISIFKDGKLARETSLQEIRDRLDREIEKDLKFIKD